MTVLMDYTKLKDVRERHCKWIRDNLSYYYFTTERAKALREKIKSLDFESKRQEDIEQIKKTYVDFVNRFYNNPYGYYGGIAEADKDCDIYADDYNYYFVRNNYGVYIPVGYAKNMRAEVEGPQLYQGEVNDAISKRVSSMGKSIEKLKDSYSELTYSKPMKVVYKSVLFQGIVTVMALADIFAIVKLISDVGGFPMNAPMIITLVVLCSFSFIALVKATNKISYCAGLAKANKAFIRAKEYAQSFHSKAIANIKELETEIKSYFNSDKTSLSLVPRVYNLPVDKLDAIAKLGERKKKYKHGAGIITLIILMLIMVPFVNIYRYDRSSLIAKGNYDVFVKSALFQDVNPDDYLELSVINIAAASASYLNPEGAAAQGSDISKFTPNLEYLYDGEPATDWWVDSYPLVITFRLEPSHTINYIKIINGKHTDADNYPSYRKPKTATLNFSDGTAIPCHFTNTYEEAVFKIDLRDKPINADIATLTITEYYTDGSDDDDMHICEVTFFE